MQSDNYSKEITLRNKTVFGIIMRKKELCRKCLERILNRPIADIDLPEVEKTIDLSFYSKGIRLDVYCKDNDEVINVEMQNDFFSYLPKRGRYYQVMMDKDMLDKGDPYTKLKRNVIIFICRFDMYGLGRHIYTFENRCVDIPELSYGDGTQKIILNTVGTADDIPLPLKVFLDYIETGEPKDEYTEEIETVIDGLRNDREWRNKIMTYEQKWEMEKEAWHEQWKEEGLEAGRAEGRAVGLEEGRAEGRAEGHEEGLDQAYIKYASKLSSKGVSDTELKDSLVDMFDISDEKADYIISLVNEQS